MSLIPTDLIKLSLQKRTNTFIINIYLMERETSFPVKSSKFELIKWYLTSIGNIANTERLIDESKIY